MFRDSVRAIELINYRGTITVHKHLEASETQDMRDKIHKCLASFAGLIGDKRRDAFDFPDGSLGFKYMSIKAEYEHLLAIAHQRRQMSLLSEC